MPAQKRVSEKTKGEKKAQGKNIANREKSSE